MTSKTLSAIPVLRSLDVPATVDFHTTKLGFTCLYQEGGFAILGRDNIQLNFTYCEEQHLVDWSSCRVQGVYILAQILHDWDDERSIAILQQCRRAIPEHGRLLVIELVLPTGEEPFLGKWLDLHMLVLFAARERTAAEYEDLFQAAGFALARVIPTKAGPSILEGVPV